MFEKLFSNKGSKGDMHQKSAGPHQIPLQGLLQDYPDSDALFSGNSYKTAAGEGYTLNYVIHKIVDDISKMASNIPITVEGDANAEALLNMPVPGVGYKKWMKRAISEKMLDGNAFAQITKFGNRITRLDQLRPDRVSATRASCDRIVEYQYTCGQQKSFPVDPITGISDMFHSRFYNPLDTEMGLSPVKAAYKSLVQNNEIARIHTAILKNDGAPKGFITMVKPTNDGFAPAPDDEKMNKLRRYVNHVLGTKNRGKLAVMNWLMKYERMGQTGQEMDWAKNKEDTAREMAIALGYPAFLLGFSEGSTFNNVDAAANWLVLNTVLPILTEVLEDLEMMFLIHSKVKVEIKPNEEEIIAIQELIRSKRTAAREDFIAGVITDKEARIEGGYEEIPDGTIFMPTNRVPLGMDVASLTALTGSNED